MSIWRPPLILPTAKRLWTETDGGVLQNVQMGCDQCGCESCSPFSDDFNRADDTDLGADWSEVSGSWAISSNRLVTSSTSALCIATAAFTSTSINTTCIVRGAANDVVRLVFAYEDSSNYWYAQLTIGSSKTLLVVQVSSGTHTTRATNPITTSAATDYTLHACVTDIGRVHAEVLNMSGLQISACSHTTASIIPDVGGVGVGTGSTAASVQFDDFYARRVSENCDDCVPVCETCDDGITPLFWDVELPDNMLGNLPTFNWGCNGTSCANMGQIVFRVPFYAVTPATAYCGWALDISAYCTRAAPTYPPTNYKHWLAVQVGTGSGSRVWLSAGDPNAIHPEPSVIYNLWQGGDDGCTNSQSLQHWGAFNGGICHWSDLFDPSTMDDAIITPVF